MMADIVQSAHSPRSPPRCEGRGHRYDWYVGQNHEQYDHRLGRDDRRRMPMPPPTGGSYVPRQYDDRRPYNGERRVPVDPREPGFDARSILVQGLVDRNRAHREGLDRGRPIGSRVHVSGPETCTLLPLGRSLSRPSLCARFLSTRPCTKIDLASNPGSLGLTGILRSSLYGRLSS